MLTKISDSPIDGLSYVRKDGLWQILALSDPITQLNTDLGLLTGVVSGHTTQIGNLQTLTTSHTTSINTNTSDISNLTNTVNNLSLNALTDVDLTIPASSGQILKYNGSQFVASNDTGGITDISQAGDVAISTPLNGELLTYNTLNQKWINQTKPQYSVYELNNYDNTIAKQNDDVLQYDQGTDKW